MDVCPSTWVVPDWTLVAKDAQYQGCSTEVAKSRVDFPSEQPWNPSDDRFEGAFATRDPWCGYPEHLSSRPPVIEKRRGDGPITKTSVHSSPAAKTQRPSDPIQVASSHAAPCVAGAHNPQ